MSTPSGAAIRPVALPTTSSDVESVGDSAVGSDEEMSPKTSKEVIGKVNRCFASVRAAPSDHKVKSAELTRCVQVCVAKLYKQSITLERLMLESAADADKFAELRSQLKNMAADMETTSENTDGVAEEEDAVSSVVSIRVSCSVCSSLARPRGMSWT